MSKVIKEIEDIINKLEGGDENRKRLSEVIKSLKKEKLKNDFKHNRFIKDKTIAVNLLEATIEDLEKKKEIISNSNRILLENKELIEHKNRVLEIQKKRIEEQTIFLEENLEKLSSSYSELEQFTYIASHDLKSPLRTISNFGQLLNRRIGKGLDSESKEFLDFIISGAKQMNTVICDLLEFAHVGNKNIVEDSCNLNDVLEIVKFNLAAAIQENEVIIEKDCLPEIFGLKSSLIQLFQNLIGNAIKFRKEEEQPRIKITFEDKGDDYYFEIQDNGVGMEEEYQKKAFMPFQRINNLDRPGSGMGLAICKKVVSQYSGKIWFRSTRGQGTVFCFTLNKFYLKNKSEKNKVAHIYQ